MELVLKSYLTIFLLFMGVFTLTGILSADMDISRAKAIHADVINEIENSDFSRDVINACIQTVEQETDYHLYVEEMCNDQGRTVMAEVILTYDYVIPFLGIEDAGHEIRGYAR
jgi:hypothetical protein